MLIAALRLPVLRLPKIGLPKMEWRQWSASVVLAAVFALNLLAALDERIYLPLGGLYVHAIRPPS